MFDSESINALILGIVQGLTEFLPVSSSGHIEIARYLLESQEATADGELASSGIVSQLDAKKNTLMTVVLHFATALSTVVVFRNEILEILSGLFRGVRKTGSKSKEGAETYSEEFWFCVKIVISMIPAATIGVLFQDQIESLFSGRMVLVGAMLFVTGILLLLADRAKVTDKPVSVLDAVIVGVAQTVAILPGISRSGATISTSVLLGIDRTRAAKFSFLMVVPLIFGKMALDVLKAVTGSESMFENADFVALGIGFVASFVTGILACQWMIKLVKACQLYWFSIYCFLVGSLAVVAGLMART